jgi:hypothetical protein
MEVSSGQQFIILFGQNFCGGDVCIVTDLINTLPGNSSVSTVQHTTVDVAVFSRDPTEAPIDWLGSDQVIYVYCRSCLFRGYISK